MELSEERHRKMHKASGAFADCNKKRREVTVEIRKKKRDQILDEKRKINLEDCPTFSNISAEDRNRLYKGSKQDIEEIINGYIKNLTEDITTVMQDLLSAHILARITELAVSCEDSTSDVAKRLFTCIYELDQSNQKHNSSLVMGMRVLKHGLSMSINDAVDAVELLQSIALFVEVNHVYRNIFFLEDFLLPAYSIYLKLGSDLQVAESFLWLLSLLCRDLERYPPPSEKLELYLSILKRGIHSTNMDFKMGSLKILAAICNGGGRYVEELIKYEIVDELLTMTAYETPEFMVPIVSALCSIEESYYEVHADIWKRGLVKPLVQSMASDQMAKNVCYIFYCLCEQKQDEAAKDLIDAGALDMIPNVLEKMDYHTRREAVYFIASLLFSTRSDVHEKIVRTNILRHLSDLLTVMDVDFLEELLTIFDIMLQHGQRTAQERQTSENHVAVAFEEFGGRARLDYLAQCDIPTVSNKAQYLIEEFLENGEEQLYSF